MNDPRNEKPVKHTINTPYPVGPVHIYTFNSSRGPILFDTGPPTPEAAVYLKNNLDIESLKYIFMTHTHPDHYGQIAMLQRLSGAKVVFSRYDAVKHTERNKYIHSMTSILEELGMPDQEVKRAEGIINWFLDAVPFPEEYEILEESKDIEEKLGIKHMRCPGHSQSDIVYLYRGYAISGDVVLRDIFTAPLLDPDFDTWDRRFSNYRAFCRTIGKLMEIRDLEFLPSHNDYVDSVEERLTFYVSKLAERAALAVPHIRRGKTIWETFDSLFSGKVGTPLAAYVKLSETAFISDFCREPEHLITALKDAGLFQRTEPFLKQAGCCG